jgi:hypothetical protein
MYWYSNKNGVAVTLVLYVTRADIRAIRLSVKPVCAIWHPAEADGPADVLHDADCSLGGNRETH